MSDPLRKVPELDASACVRGRLRGASCADCALSCPAGAIMPTPSSITLAPDLCSGCGQCQGACPAGALGAPDHPPVQGALMVLACSKVGGPDIGCAHALGLEDLARLWLQGVRQIAVATADCGACEDAPETRLDQRVSVLNRLLAPRGLDPLRLRRARPEERAREDAPSDPARRRAFGQVQPEEASGATALSRLQALGPADAPYAVAPEFDPNACTGCNACIRICPEGALMLVKDAGGSLCYQIDAAACTGCALCEDCCDDTAIHLSRFAAPPAALPLVAFRCRSCGVESVAPVTGEAAPHLCRICRKAPHARTLFQTLT